MKIYTTTGDDGSTATIGAGRLAKSHLMFGVLGDIDELNAHLGSVKLQTDNGPLLLKIQGELLDLGAEIASMSQRENLLFQSIENSVKDFENAIDLFESQLSPLTTFILPGGCASSSQLHIARTVARRAERNLVKLCEEKPSIRSNLVQYLNRLSDLLFVLARFENVNSGQEDTIWKKQ